MSKRITMTRWQNGGGISLAFVPQYGGHTDHASLDFADVDRFHELIHEYREHPSPYCLTEQCPVHSARKNPSPLRRLGSCGRCQVWGWVRWVYGPTGKGYLCSPCADDERQEIQAIQDAMR